MNVPRYTVLLYPELEEGGYSVFVPALPGCITMGSTVEEGLANAREAIDGYLAVLADRGEEAPEEAAPPVVASLDIPAARTAGVVIGHA